MHGPFEKRLLNLCLLLAILSGVVACAEENPSVPAVPEASQFETDIVVLGIHGLAPKPPEGCLIERWREAIHNGLVVGDYLEPNEPLPFRFELVYWAEIAYPGKNTEEKEPCGYEFVSPRGGKPTYASNNPLVQKGAELHREIFSRRLGVAFNNLERQPKVREVLGQLTELGPSAFDNYENNLEFKVEIQQQLIAKLDELEKKNTKVVLIAHSMGAVVAYDVLKKRDQQVEHLLTIGSPLAMQFTNEDDQTEGVGVVVPQNILRWSDFADPLDLVALDSCLGNDFSGSPGAIDDYYVVTVPIEKPEGVSFLEHATAAVNFVKRHESKRYLRTPEFADVLAGELGLERAVKRATPDSSNSCTS